MSGWEGIKVRHADVGAGVITSEFVGFGFRGLTITADNGQEPYVQLNDDGTDKGARGWEWQCENHTDGPKWMALGSAPKADPNAADSEDTRKRLEIAAINLSPHEKSMLVRLVTDRRSQELFGYDHDMKPRAMASLVEKGMATIIDNGWKLTPTGQIRSTSIY